MYVLHGNVKIFFLNIFYVSFIGLNYSSFQFYIALLRNFIL